MAYETRAPYKHDFGQEIDTATPLYNVDHSFIAHVVIPKPVAADSDAMVDGAECTTGAEADPLVITAFAAQPAWPRNIVVTVAATTAADVAAGKITVTGVNMAGETITEEHTVTADTPATFTGAKAFKAVTSVSVPVQDGASVTVDVGWGDLYGIPYKLTADELVILKLFNNATDAGTVANSATVLESNTYDPNGTPDGLKDIELYIIV